MIISALRYLLGFRIPFLFFMIITICFPNDRQSDVYLLAFIHIENHFTELLANRIILVLYIIVSFKYFFSCKVGLFLDLFLNLFKSLSSS
jgi:hypothetical protein